MVSNGFISSVLSEFNIASAADGPQDAEAKHSANKPNNKVVFLMVLWNLTGKITAFSAFGQKWGLKGFFRYFCGMEKMILLGKTPEQIQEIVAQLDLPRFTGKQIVDWIYNKRCASFDEMTNLSKSAALITKPLRSC